MQEIINELCAELKALFNVVPGYFGQKEKIFNIIELLKSKINNKEYD